MDRTDVNRLLHALECHAKQKQSGDLQGHWQINKNLSKSCDLWLVLRHHTFTLHSDDRRWDRKSSSILQVFDGVENVSQFWRLNSSAKDVFRLVLVPQLDLKNQLFEWATLHLRLRVLWDRVVIEVLGAQSKHNSVCDSSSSTCSLLG